MTHAELDPAWRTWVATNLARGVDPTKVASTLADHRVDRAQAMVRSIRDGTDMTVIAELIETIRRRDQVISLQRSLVGTAAIESRRDIDAESFMAHYFRGNRPVHLQGYVDQWPATQTWNHEWLAANYGEIDVQVCAGRDDDVAPDRNAERLTVTIGLGTFIDQLLSGSVGNDMYAVSNNRLLQHPALHSLLADLRPDEAIFPVDRHRHDTCALWIGAQGTLVPLHHDTTNVLLCQIEGRKRVELVAPFESTIADSARDFYAAHDIGSPGWHLNHGDVVVHTVELEAGDAVFLPVGWWHRVEALEPSISVGLMGFADSNDFSWYRPGTLR